MSKEGYVKKGGVPVLHKLDAEGKPVRVIAKTRYLVPCKCECCGHILYRAVQDLIKASFGKGEDVCPNCGAKVVWKQGLLPDELRH